MIDIHCHILYGIDDGCRSIEDAIAILKEASINNVKDIILTPHYIKDTTYNTNNKDKVKLLNQLKKELKKQKIDINLYLGNEVYIDCDIIDLLDTEISTLSNSKYLLIELPMNNKFDNVFDIVSILKKHDIIPIIAHPERYTKYYKDYKFFSDLSNMGCLFQSNIGSIYGLYGRKPKKMVKGLLKRNLISFFGSDVHKNGRIYQKDIYKELYKIIKNKEIVDNVLHNNAMCIIKNIDIER